MSQKIQPKTKDPCWALSLRESKPTKYVSKMSKILRFKTFLGTQCSSPYSISRHMAERWLQKNKRQIERLRAKCAVWQCVKSESFSVEISCCCCLAFLFQISFHWKITVTFRGHGEKCNKVQIQMKRDNSHFWLQDGIKRCVFVY